MGDLGSSAPSENSDPLADRKGFSRIGFLDDRYRLSGVQLDLNFNTLAASDRLLGLCSDRPPQERGPDGRGGSTGTTSHFVPEQTTGYRAQEGSAAGVAFDFDVPERSDLSGVD